MDLVHGPVDQNHGRSMVDQRPQPGGTLARDGLAGDSGLGFSLWEHLEDEGTEGILTTTLVGNGAVRFGRATVDRGGGRSFLMGQCLEHGERELGVGLDAVERWGALGYFI
jgi:hypothetical protein